jgi:hypothetical protein
LGVRFHARAFEIEGEFNRRRFDVTSIARPASPNDCHGFPKFDRYHRYVGDLCLNPPDPDLLMVREICMSKPDTWWLFTPMDARFQCTVTDWFLLNYKEKMFIGEDMANGLVWNDSWDENNWRRYKLRKSARNDRWANPLK